MAALTRNTRHRLIDLISNERILVILGIILILLVLGIHFWSLTTYPVVDGDEPWFADAIWNFVNHGVLFDTMHTGPLDQFGYVWARRYFLGILPWAAAFKLAGLGLAQIRFTSLLCGIALLIATYIVGRKSYGSTTGVLAVLLLVMSPPFFLSGHVGRQDILLAAVLMMVYALVLAAFEHERWWAHLMAGLLMGFSLDVHQNVVMFVPAFVVLYMAHYGRQLFKRRGTWLAALGGLIGVAYYLIVFVLPSPETYIHLYSFDFAATNQTPLQNLSISGLVGAVREEIGRYRFYDNNLNFAMIGAGFVYLLFRRQKLDRYVLILVGVSFVVFTFLRGEKSIFYAILLYPFMMLIVAEAFVGLIRGSQILTYRSFTAALLLLFLFNSAFHIVRPIEDNRGFSYYGITDEMKTVMPDGSVVMGLPTWWLGFQGTTAYHSSLTLNFYGFFNDYSLQQGLEAIKPDYIIFDDILRGAMASDRILPSPWYGLPGDEFRAFLDKHGTLALTFDNQWYGVIEVYAIDWNTPD